MRIHTLAALAAGALITIAVVLAAPHLRSAVSHLYGLASRAGAEGGNDQRLVVVDVVRVVNAQRAAAARLMNRHADLAAVSTLTRPGGTIEAAVDAVTPPQTWVLVKQAVVKPYGDALPDITDQVLDYLGLPTDVPSVNLDAARALQRSTDFGNSQTYSDMDQHYRSEVEKDKDWLKEKKNASSDRLIP